MIPEFELVEPRDLPSALAALEELGPKARAMAGGTDVLLAMRDKGLKADCLVYIGLLPELRGIEETPDGGISIGAATPLHEVETSTIVHRLCPLLAEAVRQIGSVQVRNRGTLGGNVCNASPSADSAPVLLVLQ
ncbi:MAG: FAD binding domain-containing protein, partial [Chloroflexota bacterium]|nr:FAD binding domain-containing protein [Chloroflexota bacterium]